MGILKLLTITCLIFFPLGEFGRYILPAIGNAPLLINDVLVGITVVTWLVYKTLKKEKIEGKLLLPIVLFLVACLVSLLVNTSWLTFPQLFISSLYIVRWGIYAGVYFVITEFDKKFRQKILSFLLVISHVVVGIGYTQYFLYPSLRSLYHLGWDEHLYRMFSVFLDPNFAGVFFVLVFILTIAIALQKIQQKNVMLASILFMLSFFDLLAVYLTYSRSALLMLFVSVLVFLWLYGKKKYIFVSIMLLFAIILLSPKSFQTEGTNILRITSSEARLASAENALDIFSKHPVFGVGFNAYRYAQNRYGYISGKYWVVSHAGAGTDNSFLFVLATTGLVGISMYIFLWYKVFLTEKIMYVRKENHLLGIATITSIIGVFMSGIFINSLFYVFIMQWLWILIALTTSEKEKD